MSAYMVSKAHIDTLLALALHGPKGTKAADWHAHRFQFFHDGTWYEVTGVNADEIGDMLVRENLCSIHKRYPETLDNPDDTPGPVEQYWGTAYRFTLVPRPSAVEALKGIQCYEYQSCEHEEWKSSQARAFCEALRSALIHELPGYDAAPWGWDEVEVQS